jgi:hypothetical protein
MFSNSKVKIAYGSYPTEFSGSTQNVKKMAGTPNHSIKSKKIKKKFVLYLKNEKESKIRIGVTRRNLQA